MKYLFVALIFALLSCQPSEKSLSAADVVDKAIEYSGKSKLTQNELEFTFREFRYKSTPTCEGFQLERTSLKEPIRDVVFQDNVTRFYKDSVVQLADSTAFLYYESVNSVHYFTQLPLRLKDDAVILKDLGIEEIQDKTYHKIEVKFTEDGGGVDFEDIYIYWFDVENYALDYLAYSFLVNGGGLRFRKAINRQRIGGVVFQDYKNYKPKNETGSLDSIGKLFDAGQLELLSVIENEAINLSPIELNCN